MLVVIQLPYTELLSSLPIFAPQLPVLLVSMNCSLIEIKSRIYLRYLLDCFTTQKYVFA